MFSFLNFSASASPAPASGSSAILDAEHGLFRSTYGFSISKGSTDWIQSTPPSRSANIATLYRAPHTVSGVQPALTVRADHLATYRPLKVYARQWMKDYHRLGFDVINSKPIQVTKQTAFLIDVIHRESAKQLRQVVFLRDRTAVVLTCRDHRSNFEQTVKACNNIVRTFRWIEAP